MAKRRDSTPDGKHRRLSILPVYAAMLYLGLLCALVVADTMARRMGLPPVRVLLAALILVPVLLAGARALAVALNWSYFRRRPAEILRVGHGGAAMYGALLPALLVSIPLLGWLGLPYGSFWDIMGVAILVGMIPTRFGCLGAGCCRGRVVTRRWPAGLRGHEWRLPNQMFEALLAAALLLVLGALRPVLPFSGAAFLIALGGYAVGRFCLEWLREEQALPVYGLSAFQWMSAGIILTCTAGLGAGIFAGAGTGPSLALLDIEPEPGTAAGRLLMSGLLLLPIMLLFRFLGCSLLLSDSEPTPRFLVRLNAAFPDLGGQGEFVATMTLEEEENGEEIPESPVDLLPVAALPDGRLAFETLIEIDQGDYLARCLVTRPGTLARSGTCTGSLNGPDLVVRFAAEDIDPPDVLNPQLCFEVIP